MSDPTEYYKKIKTAAENALSNKSNINWNEVGPAFTELAKDLAEERITLIEGLDNIESRLVKMGKAMEEAQKALSGEYQENK